MRCREEQLLAVSEGCEERVRPVLQRHGKRREGGPGKPVRCDDEQRLLARRADQADRLCEPQPLAEPLQGELRAIGDFGAADESLEQAEACAETLVALVRRFSNRHAHTRDVRVRRSPVALNCGSARADAQQRGRPGRRT